MKRLDNFLWQIGKKYPFVNKINEIRKDALAVAKKPFVYLPLLSALSTPLAAQVDPDEFPPEINIGDMLNPYKQPNDRSLDWYGSGDVDGDGLITYWGDFTAMVAGTENDQADIDGDGVPSTDEDIAHYQDYWDGNIDYLQGWWNRLETREESESWLEKMLVIDQTNTDNTWVDGSIEDRFISGNFRDQLRMNFYGFDKQNEDDNDIPVKYDTTNIGRFNIPLYGVSVDHLGSNWGHGMNAILLGENPLNFEDWGFVEPQDDGINIIPPSWNMPYNSVYRVQGALNFNQTGSPDMALPLTIVRFIVDETGEDSLYYDPIEELITERPDWISDFPEGLPTVGIDTRTDFTTPSEFELYSNYPNPFNPTTTFSYKLPEKSHVHVDVYNIQGAKVKSLIDTDQNPGRYKVNFDASNESSGIYLYTVQAGDQVKTGKMTVIK